MAVTDAENPLLGETTCGSLLQKLQEIWNEVGESDEERDKMLLQLEQECLDVYKRKVELATKSRAQLLQDLSDAKHELSGLLSALGEKSFVGIPEKPLGTIKEQLGAIKPVLEQLWKQKEERVKEFSDVQSQIQKICGEIAGNLKFSEQVGAPPVDEADLSLKKLDEYQAQLQELQKEKSDRLHKVLEFVSTVHDLCAVLGMDFFSTVTDVHPSLNDSTSVQSKSISNDTLSRMAKTVLALKEDKKERLHKLQELATQLIDLWNLMDTSTEERKLFDHVTCNISSSVEQVTLPGALALDIVEQAEVEVERLDQLKASTMKEIAFKRQTEPEEIFARAHIEIDPEAAREKIMELNDSGNVEPTELLADMDNWIAKAKEEALSRKDILDKVEKWTSACEEESWLEDYNRDENRYNASRGAHLNHKRMEKAQVVVNKIPALVDTLVAKTRAWEEDHGISFTYDCVPPLGMLDEYAMLRHEREEEKRRPRDDELEEEDKQAKKLGINLNASTGEQSITKVARKPKLPREQRENIRFTSVQRKKDFICFETVKGGRICNIVEGLELHIGVFSAAEQRRIVDFVYDLQKKGEKGALRERTYSAPRKWMRGKGRVTIQFGCCYNYARDRKGNKPGILQNETVDPMPQFFKVIIKRLVGWHVLPPTCVPDSCIVNIYEEGDCIPPHIDSHDFVRPFCTVIS